MLIAYIISAVVIILIIAINIRVVPQGNVFIIERLGKYKSTWEAGLHVKIPLVDSIVKKITLKEQILDSPPQPVITKDNVTMQIDTVVYFRVFNPKDFTYGVVDPLSAIENLTATTLRNEIGNLELDGALTSRDEINNNMTRILDDATDKWGIKVTRVEVKNIIPPREIQQAMEKQMKAERDKRATMLEAEAHKNAIVTRAEGDKEAKVLAAQAEKEAKIAIAEGEAQAVRLAREAEAAGIKVLLESGIDERILTLKKYEALVDASNSASAKLIIPSDVVDTVTRDTIFSETTELGNHTKAK